MVSISEARGLPVGSRTAVEGTVTVQAGRILRPGVTFLQDGTGGIAIDLPDDLGRSAIEPGTILRVVGTVADPYANLELRPARPSDVTVLGSGGLPAAASVSSDDLTESREGRLVRASGTISRVETGSNGSFAITLRDDAGELRVFVFATVGIERDPYTVGARLRATGIAGQRETSSGAGDGYRIWPRDRSDLVVTAADPTPRPDATTQPPRDDHRDPPVVRISAATEGRTVTLQGIVTSPAGLFDGDDRRFTLQDGSGAILVRLPDGASGPKVGVRIRVAGKVGTWYGGRQLEADEAPSRTGRGAALPVALRRTPGQRDEWKLVRVTVRIEDVARDGDTWRAEASLGAAGTLPIVGIAGSGISPDALAEGRNATITGIVKRAHPSASDQRFGIVPRDAHDIRLGSTPKDDGDGGTDTGGDAGDRSTESGDGSAEGDGDGSGIDDVPVGVSLRGAAGLLGRRVRVSGALRIIDTPLLELDDGSGRGQVRLVDGPPTFEPPLRLGEVVNVTGTVVTRDIGGWEIVTSAEGLLRASALGLQAGSPEPTQETAGVVVASAVPEPGTSSDRDVPIGSSEPLRLLSALVVCVAIAALGVFAAALALGRARRRPRTPPAAPPTTPA